MKKQNVLNGILGFSQGKREKKLKSNYKWGLACLFFLIINFGFALYVTPAHGLSLSSEEEELEEFMSELVTQQLEENKVAGATLSIVKDGEVLLSEGYGFADLEEQAPVDGDSTLFRIGSVSKLVTWTAVMQLVEEGKLDLDADVNEYIDFELPATLHGQGKADPAPITMRHLLTHTPGFEDVGEGLFVLSEEAMKPLEDYLQDYMPARVYPPGEVMAYSNYGTALAGYIVAQVSGQDFAEYVEENIFEPLGMDKSTFRQPIPDEMEPYMSRAYNYVGDEYHKGGFEYISGYPAGSMSTTAADMGSFMIAHLQNGQFEERRILEEETAQKMHQQQFTHHPQVPGMTLGFIEDKINGERVIMHNGATMIFFSHLYLVPEHDLGFFVSYNGGDVLQAMKLFQGFMDKYYPQEEVGEKPSPPEDARERAADYLGEYHPTRISFTSSDKFIGLLQAVQVSMDEDGYLTGNLMGEHLRFAEVAPDVYQNVETEEAQLVRKLAFVTGPDGQPLLASGATTYSKAPWHGTLSFMGIVMAVSLLIILGTLIGWTVASLSRFLKRKEKGVFHPPAAHLARRVAVAFSLASLVFLVGMVIIFSDIDPAYGVPNIIFGIITPGMYLVFAMPWLMILLVIGLVLFAVMAWKNKYWTKAGRIHYSLFTVSSLSLIWVLAVTNMV